MSRSPRKRSSATAISTSLLTFLTCQCGIVAFHGPTVAGRLGKGVSAYDRDSFVRVLTIAEPAGEIAADHVEPLKTGEARGRLLGGTLVQLAAAAGTPYALTPWDDTILLLEDVGERPYRIDRLVQQLRLSGALAHVRGIVLGTFPGCDEPGNVPRTMPRTCVKAPLSLSCRTRGRWMRQGRSPTSSSGGIVSSHGVSA